MPTDPVGPRDRRPDPPSRGSPPPWWQRLGDAKLPPAIALRVFLGLVVLSAMAAGVGFVAHHFRAAVTQPR